MEHVAALLGNGTLHDAINQLFERRKHFANVGEAQEFKKIYLWVLLHSNHGWDSCENIKDEIALQVGLGNLVEVSVRGRRNEEAETDFDAPGNVIDPDKPEHFLLQR